MTGWVREAWLVIAIGWLVGGCAVPYAETDSRHELKLTVVYTDRDTINSVARDRGSRSQASGFYDPIRHELWCPDEETREAFRTCGHELRHVLKRNFHK